MNISINEVILHKFKPRFLEQKEVENPKKYKHSFNAAISIIGVVIIIISINIFSNKNFTVNTVNDLQKKLPKNISNISNTTDVFITKIGSKYHLEGCRYLKNKTTTKLNIKNYNDILKKIRTL